MAKKVITTDTTLNKNARLTVRLSPRQAMELSNIARSSGCRQSGIVRGLIDRLIDAHDAQQR